MSPVSFGLGLFGTEPVDQMVRLAQLGESHGFDTVWVGDSHLIWREPYVTMTACALQTSRVRIGTGVTNPLTRDVTVTASGFMALQELTGGRMILGIGLGDSAVRTMGARPVTLKTLEAAIDQIRRLHRGESVAGAGGSQRLLAASGTPVPVYIAGSGPRLLELGGRVADGVIVLVGVDSRLVDAAIVQIHRGAAAAGRPPRSVRIVLWVPYAVGSDTASLAAVKSHIARIIIRPLPLALDAIEQDVADRVKAEYDYYRHMDVQSDHGRLVPDALVSRWALATDPGQCAETVRRVAALGVDEVAIIPYAPPGGDRAEVISTFARDVIARVRT
jgi:5,10-methylenetetrahydromethanopterin reductase